VLGFLEFHPSSSWHDFNLWEGSDKALGIAYEQVKSAWKQKWTLVLVLTFKTSGPFTYNGKTVFSQTEPILEEVGSILDRRELGTTINACGLCKLPGVDLWILV
jgi:hypothetical protein